MHRSAESEAQLEATHQLAGYLLNVLGEKKPPSGAAVGYAWFSLARLLNVLLGLESLGRLGLAAEAAALGRIAAEMAIKLAWVAGDDDRARYIIDEATLKGQQVAKLWVDAGMTADPAELQDLDKDATEVRQRRGLAAKDKLELALSSMADQVDARDRNARGLRVYYDLFYRVLCFDAHPDIRSLVAAGQPLKEANLEQALFCSNACAILATKLAAEQLARTDFDNLEPKLMETIKNRASAAASP